MSFKTKVLSLFNHCSLVVVSVAAAVLPTFTLAQLAGGVYDFGQGKYGERRDDWTPTDWFCVILLIMTIAAGLAISIGLCYWVRKRELNRTMAKPSAKMQKISQVSPQMQASPPTMVSETSSVAGYGDGLGPESIYMERPLVAHI